MSRFSLKFETFSLNHLAPLKISLIYFLAAGGWVLLTDRFLLFKAQDISQLSHLQTVKGWIFVLISTVLLYWLVWHNLREIHRRKAELQVNEERFRSVFATAAAGMFLMHTDGAIFQVNSAFCKFVGFKEEELLGKSISDVTHPADREQTSENYQSLFSGKKKSLHYEKRYLTRDGRVVWGYASVACLLNQENLPGYCIGLVQDISERKQAEEALRIAHQEMEAFAYTVSHDLRSPLTPIIGYAELLAEKCRDRLDEQELGFLYEISATGNRMVELMANLLTLAKVGRIEPPKDPVDPEDAAREIVSGLTMHDKFKGVSVNIGSMPLLYVPRTLVLQILDNLICNALCYGCTPDCRVEIGGERRGEAALIFVRDHGHGIPVEERDFIFDAFYRGTNGNGREGSGIGLATVQKIARLFSGRAWVEETPGGGSTFWVELIDSSPSNGDDDASLN